MSVLTYTLLHVLGVIFLISGVFGAVGVARAGGVPVRLFGVLHGLGLVALLVSGFGLMAKLGYPMTMGFFHGKLFIWLLFGASFLFLRRTQRPTAWAAALLVLGASAAYLGVFRPF